MTFARMPRFEKLKRLPRLAGLGALPSASRPTMERMPTPEWEKNAEEIALDVLARQIGGDRKLAKRIMSLRKQFPQGTAPELIVYDWLARNSVPFTYQAVLYGGRAQRGGLLPDFVVKHGRTMAWQVQGEYWHSTKLKGMEDYYANLRMLGQVVDGSRIETVVELWEDDIYRKRPQIFYMALAGIGLRQ